MPHFLVLGGSDWTYCRIGPIVGLDLLSDWTWYRIGPNIGLERITDFGTELLAGCVLDLDNIWKSLEFSLLCRESEGDFGPGFYWSVFIPWSAFSKHWSLFTIWE